MTTIKTNNEPVDDLESWLTLDDDDDDIEEELLKEQVLDMIEEAHYIRLIERGLW